MSNSNEIKNKIKDTCLKKYRGMHFNKTENVKLKRESTNLKNHGVKHTSQCKEIREKIDKTNIKNYGFKTPLQNESIKNKIRETIQIIYGVDNVSKSDVIKAQKIATTFSNYGVMYPLQNKEIMNKAKNTMNKNYGVEHNSYIRETLEKREKTWLKNYGVKNPIFINNNGVSKISQKLFWQIYNKLSDKLKQKCYFSELNKEFDIEDKKNKIHYLYDFVISNIRFCLEFNGNYWHCNPKMFKETYNNKMVGKSAKEIWEVDNKKITFLQNEGYNVFVVWEDEYKNSQEIVLNNILKYINFC